MIFDTDVLIWMLRGNDKAAAAIESDSRPSLSVLTYMELLQGSRDKRESAVIRRAMNHFEVIPLSAEIGYRGSLYMEQLALKVALTPIDAMIAATAVELQIPLCTANVKHFRAIADLSIKAFRP